MNILLRFSCDAGREGTVNGVFVHQKEFFDSLIGKEFLITHPSGYSLYGVIEASQFQILSEEQEFIDKLVEMAKTTHLAGYDPAHYLI